MLNGGSWSGNCVASTAVEVGTGLGREYRNRFVSKEGRPFASERERLGVGYLDDKPRPSLKSSRSAERKANSKIVHPL